MNLRAVIVEDERLARQRLRSLLRSIDDVTVIGEADSADGARDLLRELKPDIVFLDVNMPGGSGFDLLQSLEKAPVVIFTTAHAEFAAEAFERSAADYLVKPFDAERVARAVERARRFIAGGRAVSPGRPAGSRRERFAVRTRGEIIFIKAAQIDWISSEGNYSRLHAGEQSWLVRESLQSIESSLDPAAFIRVHRSTIVNLDRVRKLITTPDASASIVLSTGDVVSLGPSFRGRLEEAIGEKL